MEVKLEHDNKELEITVKGNVFGGINIVQGDDLIYIVEGRFKEFAAAIRAVASDMMGEEV